jgi:hypothetical protein
MTAKVSARLAGAFSFMKNRRGFGARPDRRYVGLRNRKELSMSMQEDLANPSHPLNHIIRLGRSRARWRLFAVALVSLLAGIAIGSFD